MTAESIQQCGEAGSPVTMRNRPGEWLAAAVFCAVSCVWVMAYHDWWRAKTYSVGTLNEALAHTAYYCLALAFALGPLYRFGLLPARAVTVRRPFGIAGVLCSVLHAILSLVPLWQKFGRDFVLARHWAHTVFGVLCLILGILLLATSLGNAFRRLGKAAWCRIQLAGLALLPLALWHFMALGKLAKWADWFAGRDKLAAPPGTFIIFCVGAIVIALRIVDALCHRKNDDVPAPAA